MTLGGLVGFAVVAIVLVTGLSLSAAATLTVSGYHLRRLGPAAEGSAAAWALVAPVAIAGAIVAALAIRGSGSVDHCIGHAHHAHLCFVHGEAWLDRAWAMALAAGSGITILLRLSRAVWRRLRAHLAIAQVRRVAEPGDRVRIAPSDRVFCFVAGWRDPTVFVSSRAWTALSVSEREAVIAHEQAHASHGDLWFGAIAELAAVFAAPLVGGWLHARWADARERLCDVRAAQHTAPETVASALVRLCRVGRLHDVPAGFTPSAAVLEHRVRGVLGHGTTGSPLGALVWCPVVAVVAVAAVFAPELHHALETLLG